ncbi:asparagine synthase (glutamine-hydrolyzing) [Candidatus Woesebacteria bacterium RIFCSPLOWO2_01_FULL_43_11]|uniref:asparagine synthase (glutamine-hydrolyzing) n=1 Tax=Candidatus Woesebacteria bacterium RBG_16_42_24 TaxID=1802485 RepID=A0A1F7XKI5_9BACT|nr:MAG: asparagine synthase (glutamine-hydrolyzing) [Candidatus Woesebacteria bacterium RBG_16_42_24]OGM67948.1 MAG: asparagine synthase (glutamine-hydrolyzing) [Candidatus Woesebacteria bacterium RIFCSPLOWO2_01_FULL_43_11]
MCGIAGKVYFDSRVVTPVQLRQLSEKIIHRGPDDDGVYVSGDKKVGLVNRRLAIIDLSKAGHQPMIYKNRYAITYNGEVYNFQEERRKLEKEGYVFKSNTDTEVILALYDKYGVSFLKRLRGMFAFAIYDDKEKTLFLARDRIGKKPLKYFIKGGTFIFASELKAILTQHEVKRAIDYNAIQFYLVYGYTPAPLTGFEGIKKLQPGHYILMNLRRKTFEVKRYWEPVFRNKLRLTESEWCDRILETLEESTRLRMISDVPIGAFISGGADSSGVVYAMSKFSDKPINTFTIVFEDKRWSEAKYARGVAKKFETNHHELLAKPENVEILPELAHQYEEPFADASNVITYMVSRLARKYVTVVLNGDGGDELFAGYPNRYFRLKRDVDFYEWINRVRPMAVTGLKGLQKISKSALLTRSTNFFEKSRLPLYQRFASYNQIFSFEEIVNMSKDALVKVNSTQNPYAIVENSFRMFKGKDLKDAGLKFDLLYWLPDDLLAKVDIASMASSLEARSPLLDHHMIELAGKIPFRLKVKNGESKYIFKKALERVVPRENLYRPKMGFGVPLHIWFSGKLNSYTKGVLLSKKAKIKGLIRQDVIKNMLEGHSETSDFGPRLWALLSLELWLRRFFD